MLAICMVIGFLGWGALFFLEPFLLESVQDAPRWLDYVDGPYIREKYTAFQGRDW